ncbi:MAG: hypothetical protein P1V81_16800 [Planctomycetota bacterium]|nr:hypothetical protein [Planctomycetota bacterium]
MSTIIKTTLGTLALASLAASASAQSYTDDFNRPDSTNLGPDWVEENGDFEIQSNRAVGIGFPWDDLSIIRNTVYSGTYDSTIVSMDIDSQGKIGATAGMVTGHQFWGGVSAKLQDNDGDGLFDRVFFEAAINAGAWHGGGTPVHFDLTTPIVAGSMVLSCPDTDTAQVDVYNTSGVLVGTGTASGILASAFPPVGTEVAVYTKNGGAAIDNFEASSPTLTGAPATLSMAAGGVQNLTINMGAAHAGELYLMLGSTSGTGPGTLAGPGVIVPLNTDPYLIYTLTHPNGAPLGGSFGALDASGGGSTTFTLPMAFDPTLVGITIHHAAVTFDLTGGLTVTGATQAAPVTFGA